MSTKLVMIVVVVVLLVVAFFAASKMSGEKQEEMMPTPVVVAPTENVNVAPVSTSTGTAAMNMDGNMQPTAQGMPSGSAAPVAGQ